MADPEMVGAKCTLKIKSLVYTENGIILKKCHQRKSALVKSSSTQSVQVHSAYFGKQEQWCGKI